MKTKTTLKKPIFDREDNLVAKIGDRVTILTGKATAPGHTWVTIRHANGKTQEKLLPNNYLDL